VLDAKLLAWHRANADSRHLAQIPGIGPIGATTLLVKTPDPRAFASGGYLAAWLGLTPKDHSNRPHQQAGQMDASDPIRPSKNSCGSGAVHMRVVALLRSDAGDPD
jgi:transposase